MEKKSVTENLFYNILYQAVVTVLPVVTTPYIARVLGLHANGIHAYTESIVTYFFIVASLGTSLYGIRKVAYVRENKNELSITTIEIFSLRFLLMLISLVIYIPLLCIKSPYAYIYRIQTINIVANGIDISWFYQGVEDFKKVTIRNLLVKFLFLFGLFTLIKSPEDLPIYVFMNVTSSLFGNVLMFYYLPQYISFSGIRKLDLITHLKASFVLFIPQAMNYIYGLLDRSMLGWITNTDNVSIYDQTQRIVRMLTGLLQSLGYVMMARIANLTSNGDEDGINYYIHKSINFTLFFAIPAVAGLWAIADDFVPFFLGNEYLEVVPTLKLLAPLIVTMSLNNILGIQILIPLKKENIYAIATSNGAIANVLINIILIPYLGIKGACVSSLVAEVIVFLISFWNVKSRFDLSKIVKENKGVLFGSGIMFLVVKLIAHLDIVLLARLVLEVFIGGSIYFMITFIGKNETLLLILEKISFSLRKRI